MARVSRRRLKSPVRLTFPKTSLWPIDYCEQKPLQSKIFFYKAADKPVKSSARHLGMSETSSHLTAAWRIMVFWGSQCSSADSRYFPLQMSPRTNLTRHSWNTFDVFTR
ncbi:hypothetical protein NPIL_443411 [Nephila pilipes]|uniref:Uncharacterized protein n=1 Tax=Nephila pilipes TaxID=299642 RepID=A0A8X6N647_NEPPI|nr:hypothetical protein NPIL_443411 [Nephila pilipes]